MINGVIERTLDWESVCCFPIPSLYPSGALIFLPLNWKLELDLL